MSMIVNTSVSSLTAQRSLAESSNMLDQAMERLATGSKINSASDDATDVLRKTPLLTVDFDGNVKLQGSGKITFLMNAIRYIS